MPYSRPWMPNRCRWVPVPAERGLHDGVQTGDCRVGGEQQPPPDQRGLTPRNPPAVGTRSGGVRAAWYWALGHGAHPRAADGWARAGRLPRFVPLSLHRNRGTARDAQVARYLACAVLVPASRLGRRPGAVRRGRSTTEHQQTNNDHELLPQALTTTHQPCASICPSSWSRARCRERQWPLSRRRSHRSDSGRALPRLSCGQRAGVLIGCPSTPTTYQTFWTP